MPDCEELYGFSPSVVEEMVGEDYLFEVMKEYINTLCSLVNFPEQLESSQHDHLRLCLHTIKAASYMVGANASGQRAEKLESDCKRFNECATAPSKQWLDELKSYQRYLASNIEKINQYLSSLNNSQPPEGQSSP